MLKRKNVRRRLFLTLPVCLLMVMNLFMTTGTAVAHYDPPQAHFAVFLTQNVIEGYTWPKLGGSQVWAEGESVAITLQVYASYEAYLADSSSPAYEATQDSVAIWSDGALAWESWVRFELGGAYQILPGNYVVMTNGEVAKEHRVSDLAVTTINVDDDIVYGTADPNQALEVGANCGPTGCISVFPTSDAGGQWIADFNGIEDIVDGSGGLVLFREPGKPSENDGGDVTIIEWQADEPFLHAWVEENWVTGRDWPLGNLMDLTINRGGVEIYSASDTTYEPSWNPGITFVEFQLDIDLVAGDVVVLTDGLSTHTHIVTELAVDQTWYADADLNELYGTDADDRPIHIGIHDVDGYEMEVGPESDGSWTAKFNEVNYSFVPGSGFVITQHDASGGPDDTIIERFLPTPRILASPTMDWFQVQGASANAPITLAIYESEGGDLVTDPLGNNPWQGTTNNDGMWGLDYEFHGIDLQPEMYLTLLDDSTRLPKELALEPELSVDVIDTENEIISGIKPEGAGVWVMVETGPDATGLEVNTLGTSWDANFSGIHDITDDTHAQVHLDDGDQDETVVHYQPGPSAAHIVAYPAAEMILGFGWPVGTELTMCIDDPEIVDPNDPYDWCDAQMVSETGMSPEPLAYFDLWEAFDLQAGHIVNMTDGITERTHVVTQLTVTDVNAGDDTIWGTAVGGTVVDLWVNDPWNVGDGVTADINGDWSFDFTDLADLDKGTTISASEYDDQGNSTQVDWRLNDPRSVIIIRFDPCDVLAADWPLGSEVTLTVNDPQTPDIEYTDTQMATRFWWSPNNTGVPFFFQDFYNMKIGDVVTLTDGTTTKVQTLTLETVHVDVEVDTVSGVGVPNSDIWVSVESPDHCEIPDVAVNTEGNWVADFSSPGDLNCNPDLDIDLESWGLAGSEDDDGDQTVVRWSIEPPPNSPPEILSFQAPVEPVLFGQEVAISANFVDPDEQDMHRAWWYWGDGLNTEAYIDELNGSGTAFGNHTYASPGVYSVRLELHDDADNMADATYEYIVIYNPVGGFVTGGGWIDSPEGAYYPDPSLTGRASFGFVSRYKRGASTPEGVTQFQFRVADLNFHSEAYDWLVIAGMRAQYKGMGTINGEGAYRFILTAIDGDLHANDGVDRFRIKIWDPAVDEMIYDNQLGDLDDADPVTTLGGGSIVIHQPLNPRQTHIGLVTDLGGLDDMGWNWLAYQGLLQAEQELGVNVNVYEPASEAEFVTATQQCADDGNDLCIGVGFFLGDAFKEVSELHPDTYFAILDFTFENYPSNVRGIEFAADQAGYLAGTLAGLMSDSNTIGAIGGISIPPVNQYICGYQQGAWDANPDANVLVAFAGNFEDPASGAEIAANMMAETADVIFGIGGAMGNGAILYATNPNDPQQMPIWAIGVDTDQWLSVFGEGAVTGSEFLLSSAMKRLDSAVFYTIEDLLNGALGPGTVRYSLAGRYSEMPGVGLAPFHEATIPQYVIDALAAAEAGLMDGSIWTGYPCGFDQEPEQGKVLHVVPAHPEIHGHEWPWEAEVTVMVYDGDPDTGGTLLYEHTKPVGDDPWCGEPCFDVSQAPELPDGIQPGYVVTMSDGETIRIVHVTELQVSSVDVGADRVFGTAAPGSEVFVEIHDEGAEGVQRRAVADGTGAWFVDFSIPGVEDWEQQIYDLVPGSHGRSIQLETPDRDDGTLAYWNAPNPMIEARPQEDRIEGWDWTEGEVVNLTVVYDGGIEYTDSQTAALPPWDDPRPWVSFQLDFDLEPGDVITMESGSTIKVHTVTDLQVTGIDEVADEVYGTAAEGAYIEVWPHEGGECGQGVEVGPGTDWGVSFSGCYDIGPGSQGAAVQYDDDGDQTWIEWWAPNPMIQARPQDDRIEGWDWTEGEVVNLTVDYDGGTATYTDSQTAALPPWDDSRPWVSFQLDFDLAPGDVITMVSGSTTKVHTVTVLQVTEIDEIYDSISGTADPEAYIEAWVHETECWQGVNVDVGGNWSVTFSGCDIGPGTAGAAVQYDDDGDQTWIEWWAPNPEIRAYPQGDRIEGFDWTEGEVVNLTVDYDDGAATYTDNQTAALPPWDDPRPWVSFELPFDLEPGDVITMTSGGTTKVHTVTLQVTEIDEIYDSISGTADPGSYIEAWVLDTNCWQGVHADGVGDWGADFSGCYDIVPGSAGAAVQYDADGDQTWIGWWVPSP